MHLIAMHRLAPRDLDAVDLSEPFVAAEHRLDVEQPKSFCLARRPFDPPGVGDASSEHLVAAAQAEDMPALPMMREQVDIPTLASQKGEVGQGRLRSGQN